MNKEKDLSYISELIDNYHSLLTEKQLTYIEMYYFDDLSLNEISEEFNVSKNAIYDSIQKSINNLKEIDQKLKLIEKKKQRLALYEKIKDKELIEQLKKIEYQK